MSEPESLLVTRVENETFVVSASDKYIGRELFFSNKPFDFNKMESVLGLIEGGSKINRLVDVGANIGTICIPALKRGMFSTAIAIEPEPKNYSLLMANIYINMISDKIIAYNCALGSKDNENLAFELSSTNYGDHRVKIIDGNGIFGEIDRETINVRSETFDKIVTNIIDDESLIWIDTQGFEGYILQGAVNSISRRIPLVIEFWPYGMDRCGGYPYLKNALANSAYTKFYDLSEPPIPHSLTERSFDKLYDKLGERGAFTDLLIV